MRVNANKCLNCAKVLDAATCVHADCMHADCMPQPGSITICIYCGHIMAFGTDCSLRQLTDEEVIEIAGDPRILAIQRARAMDVNGP
jgi:hypothetical protein